MSDKVVPVIDVWLPAAPKVGADHYEAEEEEEEGVYDSGSRLLFCLRTLLAEFRQVKRSNVYVTILISLITP